MRGYCKHMAKTYKKLLELALYVTQKADGDSFLGITKLNKILFLADFHHYLVTGKPISDQTYVHAPRGPIPKDMDKIEKEGKDLVFQPAAFFKYTQKKPVALRKADLSDFTAEEIAFVDGLIDLVCKKNKIPATWLSEDSHEYIGWYITKDGEEIPYKTIYLEKLSRQKASSFDKHYAATLRQEMGADYGFAQAA